MNTLFRKLVVEKTDLDWVPGATEKPLRLEPSVMG